MGFALQAVPPALIPEWAHRTARPLVGLNVSGLLYMGGYTRSNMFGLSGDYPELMRKIVRWFTGTAGTDVVLVTHVTGAWEGDGKACAALYEELKEECGGRLHLADPTYDHREIKYLIGKCDFFLGARMHACIAALSQGIPAAGLAYSRKFGGVFESVGVGELVVDLRERGEDDTLERIETLFRERERFVERLSETAPEASDVAMNLLSRVANPERPIDRRANSGEVLSPFWPIPKGARRIHEPGISRHRAASGGGSARASQALCVRTALGLRLPRRDHRIHRRAVVATAAGCDRPSAGADDRRLPFLVLKSGRSLRIGLRCGGLAHCRFPRCGL
jgi:hypothetical protein